jgi:hypothetical protein
MGTVRLAAVEHGQIFISDFFEIKADLQRFTIPACELRVSGHNVNRIGIRTKTRVAG